MIPSREEILKSAIHHPDFVKVASQGTRPLQTGVDIQTLRDNSNAAKAKVRSQVGKPPEGIKEWEINIPMRDGTFVPAWVYGPSEDAASEIPIVLFFHGGGFCIGNYHDDFHSNRAIALRNNTLVISVEYRLAPENPFPTAIYDGFDSLQWVAANAHKIHKSASPSKGLIVGGTSAGGSIANAVIYLNRDQVSPVPVTGQFLSVPPLLPPPLVPRKYKDDYLSNEQNKGVSIPPPEMVALFMDAYKPDFSSSLFSPFNHATDLGNVPPTYLQACGVDLCRDDTFVYERVLREEYLVPTRVHLYPGLPHHFWEFYPELTEHIEQRLNDTVAGFTWLLEQGRLKRLQEVE